jgi:uncharacterized protein
MDWTYWTAYWWMLPLGIVICTMACAASVEGATMFTPLFALGFPLLGTAALSPGQAIATALIIESIGYSSGLIGHARQRTVVWRRARAWWALSIPAAAVAASLSHRFAGDVLLLTVAGVLVVLGVLLLLTERGEPRSGHGSLTDQSRAIEFRLRSADGRTYECARERRPNLGRTIAAAAGALTGLVGISVGELTTSQLILRLGWPARVAIGTSVAVVLPTVITASAVQLAMLPQSGAAIPWNLVAWTAPAVLIGGQLGPLTTAVVSERTLKRGIAVLFVVLAVVIVVSTLRNART